VFLKAKEPHLTKPIYRHYTKSFTYEGYSIPVRLYPQQDSKNVLIYIHGGGWATENIDTYTTICLNLSRATRSTVIAIDYSLAPESKFPKATEECYAVVQSILKRLLPQGKKVILIGDSAGGNLCAVVSLMCRDRQALMPTKQILLYPVTYYDYTETSPFKSVHENGTDYILTAKRMHEYITLYANTPEDFTNPYFSPLCAEDFSNQPDTLVITANFDPLRDEGELYAKKLHISGNHVKLVRMKDTLHGFFVHDKKSAMKAHQLIVKFMES
jgi:acetyl esterase/lipase